MALSRFDVLDMTDTGPVSTIDYPILINTDHIASLKTINIMFKGSIINGFWIRLANGKKYKATKIPASLEKLLSDDSSLTTLSSSEGAQSFQMESDYQ